VIPAENAVAGDDVVDVCRLETGPLGQCGEATGEQGLRVNGVQSAVGAAAPAGRTNGIENPGVDDGLPS